MRADLFIVCPRCGAKSFNLNDIAEEYCGACHQFHDALLEGDLIVAHATESRFGLQLGETVIVTHPPSKCSGENCVVHNPSDHHMKAWALNWRADRGLMERLCPVHGIGHPDPDGLDHLRRVGLDASGVHGCCGCCHTPSDLAVC